MNSPKLLEMDDILDLPGLVGELCEPENPVGEHLAALLPTELVDDLQVGSEDGFIRRGLSNRLLDGLNELIAERCVYEPRSFRYTRLNESTLERTSESLTGEDLIEVNRLLLTEAYPDIFKLVYPPRTPEWHRFQVGKYTSLRPDYERFCDLLARLLGQARADCAPMAIIQARLKTVASFAEKMWRKNYENPLCQSTDLAAARVVTETQQEVIKASEWVKENFVIDAANSVDHREKLKADEFGYVSVHYIVSLKKDVVAELAPDSLLDDGDEVWPFVAGKRAEIQIRTLLQHAHASIVHDRVYKSAMAVPDKLRRELARVSALLEESDTAFGQTIASIEAYKGSYGAYMGDEQRAVETEVLESVLKFEESPLARAEAALDLALIQKGVWDWPAVVETLAEHLGTPWRKQPKVQMEYGYALCRVHQANPQGPDYQSGLSQLQAAVDAMEDDPLVYPARLRLEAHSYLAWAYGKGDLDIHEARRQYEIAHSIEPTNPYVLASYLGFEIRTGTSRTTVGQVMEQTILEAVERCQEHARARVELPWAYLTQGRLYLLAGRAYDSLSAYCKALHLCRSGLPSPADVDSDKRCFPREILDDELRFLQTIGMQEKRAEDDWVRNLLWLGIYSNYEASDALEILHRKALREDITGPVVIVSGGTRPDIEREMRAYAECLEHGLAGFSGTLISGGTKAGIPGMVGATARRLREEGLSVHSRSYLPAYLPADAPRDEEGYDQITGGVGERFSPRQLIQTWVDLLVAGVDSATVKALGFNGGALTLLEYKLGLAMGAQTGIIKETGRAANDLARDPDWADARNLLWLPRDPKAVWAFVNIGTIETDRDLDDMGRKIHESFLSDRWPRSKDRIMRPWEYLDQDIRQSNIEQAAFAEIILRRNGYGVRKKEGEITVYRFGADEDDAVDRMAEMEHGRWTVERLRSGWRYGPVKDDAKRISPYLVSWKDLPDDVREYDREFVRQWPEFLAEAGLEVYRV